MGDFVNAIRDYQAAVKTDPSYALAYYNAANVYFRQRQFKQVSWVWELIIYRLSPLFSKRTVPPSPPPPPPHRYKRWGREKVQQHSL